MPNIADHFNMPDAEQAGDKAEQEGYYTEEQIKAAVQQAGSNIGGMPTCSYPFADAAPPLSPADRNRQLMYICQELEGCRQQLTGLGYPSIASIVNEAVMAAMGAWYETRPGA